MFNYQWCSLRDLSEEYQNAMSGCTYLQLGVALPGHTASSTSDGYDELLVLHHRWTVWFTVTCPVYCSVVVELAGNKSTPITKPGCGCSWPLGIPHSSLMAWTYIRTLLLLQIIYSRSSNCHDFLLQFARSTVVNRVGPDTPPARRKGQEDQKGTRAHTL